MQNDQNNETVNQEKINCNRYEKTNIKEKKLQQSHDFTNRL